MDRLEKCKILRNKGYTYDAETGKIYGMYGKEIKRKDTLGYISIHNSKFSLLGHHFAWYMTYNNVDFEELDHINRVRNDNRICNLRIATRQQNNFNTNSKGYHFDKSSNKWFSQIMVDGKKIFLGRFDTRHQAHYAYLIAKEKYHIIETVDYMKSDV